MTRAGAFGAAILGADGLRLSAGEKALYRETRPFGFILFARNLADADQIRALCGDMREAAGHDAPITIDQEGGRVQRLVPPLARQWTPPLDFARAAGPDAARAMYLRARLIADELRGLGLDSNCAPLCDIAFPHTHPFLRNRCYGPNPETVTALARATAQGHLDGGVLPVMKHIPGHGRSAADTHFDLPQVSADLPELEACDFAPFAALSDLPMAMTGHLVFSAIDPARPATQSADVIEVIRQGIGFKGLLMTDDIGMEALSGSVAERTRAALAAGCDVVLHCNGTLEDRRAAAHAAGVMTPAAQTRAEAAIAARHAPLPFDVAAAEAELETLAAGQYQ